MDAIGSGGGGLARAAIEAALRRQAEARADIQTRVPAGAGAEGARAVEGPEFRKTLAEGLHEVDAQVRKVDGLPEQILRGEVADLHEVAFQLQKAQLSYDFALQVRNKLIEAYREVMRMNV